MKVTGMHNAETDKIVDVSCHFLVQNTRTSRQLLHQLKEYCFMHTAQTPLSIGLPLTKHSRLREKDLVKNLSDIYIRSDCKKILEGFAYQILLRSD